MPVSSSYCWRQVPGDNVDRRILLVRHCQVGPEYRGLCYGQSDIELSSDGKAQSLRIAEQLATRPITHLFHSGLRRTCFLAELVTSKVCVPAIADADLLERNFGNWELRTWDAIFAEVGREMNGLVLRPADYAPPDGETTFALRDRVLSWYRRLPTHGLIVAITHGGPIAALRGTLLGLAADRWPELIPEFGSITETN
jgi:broad specificity phosphatase PhoE